MLITLIGLAWFVITVAVSISYVQSDKMLFAIYWLVLANMTLMTVFHHILHDND